VVREQSNAIVYAARCLGAVVRDLFVLRGRYAETRLVPDHPDVLDVPLRATLASTVVLSMFGAAIAFAGGGESGGKATALIGALFAVVLLTVVLHLGARAVRGTGTWRQTAAVVCVFLWDSTSGLSRFRPSPRSPRSTSKTRSPSRRTLTIQS
jgi:lysylphosphatidylglycerol synthetase-like protein (DUF2156 family)